MNPGTLNHARMLEHCIQHLTELPNHMLELFSNLQNKDICFSNNAANTNTQQSPPLANFWLKQIKANTYETEGYKNTIPPRA